MLFVMCVFCADLGPLRHAGREGGGCEAGVREEDIGNDPASVGRFSKEFSGAPYLGAPSLSAQMSLSILIWKNSYIHVRLNKDV